MSIVVCFLSFELNEMNYNYLYFFIFCPTIIFLVIINSLKSDVKINMIWPMVSDAQWYNLYSLEKNSNQKTAKNYLNNGENFEPSAELKNCSDWSEDIIKHVEKFVFFFGFNRCGSTATGNYSFSL